MTTAQSQEHPIRAYCHGIPVLIIDGRRVWSQMPPAEIYRRDEPEALAAVGGR